MFNLKLKTMKTNVIFLVCMLIAAFSEAQIQPDEFKNELIENEVIPPSFFMETIQPRENVLNRSMSSFAKTWFIPLNQKIAGIMALNW